MFRQDFTCPALLEDDAKLLPVRGCHPLRPAFPRGSGSLDVATGLIRFRSPLLTESRLMSFPPGTEMFQFPGFASNPYGFRIRSLVSERRRQTTRPVARSHPLTSELWRWVAPFGYPRIKACSQLPTAFRSVPRPSSPARAKASTERPSGT
jgi:hypothetical protein